MQEPEDQTHMFGLMSFSSLLHDMCLSEERMYNYYDSNKDTYGTCNVEKIMNEWIPYLKKGLDVRYGGLMRCQLYTKNE